MDAWVIAVIIVLLVIGVVAFAATRSRRSKGGGRQLKEQFGSEYDRVVERSNDRTEAERELQRRVERHEQLDIRDLSTEQRDHYVTAWRDVQRRFVDDPEDTLGEADRLITSAMRDRGYPTEHFEQKVDDLSVEHADTVNAYREAHAIADRHEREGVSTDDLRVAMQRFREIFEDIVGTHAA
jgi:hypothetical protein